MAWELTHRWQTTCIDVVRRKRDRPQLRDDGTGRADQRSMTVALLSIPAGLEASTRVDRAGPIFNPLVSATSQALGAVANAFLPLMRLSSSRTWLLMRAPPEGRRGRGRRKLLMRAPQVRKRRRREPRQLVCRIAGVLKPANDHRTLTGQGQEATHLYLGVLPMRLSKHQHTY